MGAWRSVRSVLLPWVGRSQVERVDVYMRQSLYLLLWLLPLAVLVPSAGELADRPGLAVVVLAGFVLVALVATRLLRAAVALHPRRGPLPWPEVLLSVAAGCAAGVVAVLLPTDHGVALAVSAAYALLWAASALCDPRVLAVLVLGAGVLAGLGSREPLPVLFAVAAVLFFAFTTRTSLWMNGVVRELDRARGAQAALAVAEERLRFSRDVHDVLGRRLSAIAVQSELAATLAARGDDAAAERMLEVRATAHDGLREARELARGYRATDLAQEVDGARSLLGAAGIRADVRLDGLPPAWHEAAAAVVRETVTNVLRHSDATAVELVWEQPELRVGNDRPQPAVDGDGAGLAGLRDRLAALGGGLDVERDERRFVVVAALPGSGPRGVG